MKSKKMYKSIVAIALVCVMLVMCMGAGYSVKVAKETTNVEFTIYQNEEGMFTHENEMGILKKVFSSNKVFVREAEEFDDIYVDNNGKYYHKIQDSEFAAVEKLSYNLNASDTLARLNSTDLPEEILQDIEEVSLWIEEGNVSPEAKVVLFSRPSGHISTTYTTKNGLDIRIYEVRFIGMSTNWEEIAKGTSFTTALLTTVKEVASYHPAYLPVAIFESFATAANAWSEVFGVSTINIHSDNKLTIKLDYDMKVKYGYVEIVELNHMKHSTTFSAVELDRIHSCFTYRKSAHEFGEETLTRNVSQVYKADSYDSPTDWTYQYRGVNSGTYSEYAEDLYVEYKKGLFNTKTRFRMIPPSYSKPGEWNQVS